jgi:hypothetical protein
VVPSVVIVAPSTVVASFLTAPLGVASSLGVATGGSIIATAGEGTLAARESAEPDTPAPEPPHPNIVMAKAMAAVS